HGGLDLYSTQRQTASLSRQPERAQRRTGKQRIDRCAQVRIDAHIPPQGLAEQIAPGHGRVDCRTTRPYPATPSGEIALQIRNDRAVRPGDEPNHRLRVGGFACDDAAPIVHLRATSYSAPAPA